MISVKMWGYFILLTWINLGTAQISEDFLDVQLEQGPVRGYKDPEANLFAFYGIPYATEPKGVDKFKAPLDAPTWSETLEAVDDSLVCLQPSFFVPGKTIPENCLIANVYVPNTDEENLPVLVNIHGGGLQLFYGNQYTPKRFVEENNIIVVNFNYRLGANGFLCLGTEAAPGNAGLKDMLALLNWVNANIASFGGNRYDVTLTGYSSGAHAADLFLMTRSLRGLFNKVSLESGNGIATWGIQMDPIQRASSFAEELNFTSSDPKELEEFYLNLSDGDLTSHLRANPDASIRFVVCVENDLGDGIEPFITVPPNDLITTYLDLPILNGFTNAEGLLDLSSYVSFQEGLKDNFADFLPSDLTFPNEEVKNAIAAEVRSFYFGDAVIDNTTAANFVAFKSDLAYTSPTLRGLKKRVDAGLTSIYLYEYSYFDANSQMGHAFPELGGAIHGSQSYAVFENPNIGLYYNETGLTDNYKTVRKEMRALWSNFVKTGSPVPEGSTTILSEWPVAGTDAAPYASLNLNPVIQTIPWNQDRYQLWANIYDEYAGTPIRPPSTDGGDYGGDGGDDGGDGGDDGGDGGDDGGDGGDDGGDGGDYGGDGGDYGGDDGGDGGDDGGDGGDGGDYGD